MTVTPPVKIVIDFLDGITQKKDATAYARGFIESHFDVPSLCGYYIMPLGSGYVYEAHEGGSQHAYLPRIMQMIKENPTATISVRAGKRVLQISRGAKDSFNAVLLPEELSSYLENVIDPEEQGPSLIPYETPAYRWIIIGAAIAAIGALVFVFSLGFLILNRVLDKPPQFAFMPADQLPMRQWGLIVNSVEPGGYVTALRYENGAWRAETKSAQDAENEKKQKAAEEAAKLPVITPQPAAVVSAPLSQAPVGSSAPVVNSPAPAAPDVQNSNPPASTAPLPSTPTVIPDANGTGGGIALVPPSADGGSAQ